jgi:hypothetical protein
MIVFLWQAGTAEGVTDDYVKAQLHAFCFMRRTGASTAVVEQAYYISGIDTLVSGYQRADAPRWVARRLPGGRIRRERHSHVPALTAA